MDSLNGYFEGAITQHLERGKRLLERIPKKLPRELQLLAQTCERDIQERLSRLVWLLHDPEMQLPEYQPVRLRKFRRVISDLNHYEAIGIAPLERHNKDDIFLNKLIERICHEIEYPLLPPVVTSLSQNYFHIFSDLNLMFVPPSESNFFLHLPDLYHELAHPFLTRNHPRLEPFQNQFFQVFAEVMQYVLDEQHKEEHQRGRRPEEYRFYLRQWEKSWEYWLIEYFCDLFAVVTVGPAFAWSHLYLCAKLGEDPFYVPTLKLSTHPPDDARMQVLLLALVKMGFSQEANLIRKKWKDLLEISGARGGAEYNRCFPPHILSRIVESAFKGVSGIKCRIAQQNTNDPIYALLNQAWSEFWNNSASYPTWEKQTQEHLRKLYIDSL